MQSKDLKELQDSEGYVDITNIMAQYNNGNSPYESATFKADNGIIFWKPALPNSFTHFGEVIASHIARQFGLRSSKYFFAKYKGFHGTISKDYKKENETEVLGRDYLIDYYKKTKDDFLYITKHESFNNIKFIYDALKHDVKNSQMSKFDASKIIKNLLKTFMVDMATSKADRHHKNWGLLTNNQKTRFIPVFDNGNCFNLYNKQKELFKLFDFYKQNPIESNLLNIENYFKDQDKALTPALSVLPKEEHCDGKDKPYLKVLEEFKIMFPAFFNEQLKNLYSINFTKIFKSVEEETGVAVPHLVKEVVLNSYKVRFNEIQKHFGMINEEYIEADKNLIF